MQMLINIPEEEYNLILLKQEVKLGGVMSEAERYIAKGTVIEDDKEEMPNAQND